MPSAAWTKPDISSRHIAVIGAGVMGRRIAMMWVAAGFPVVLCEKSVKNHDGAMEYIHSHTDAQSMKLGTTPTWVNLTDSLADAVSNAWMVIEAVPEILQMKIDVLGEIDKLAPPDCVIASNSSSLRTSQMLEKTQNNYRICNGHYYMPPDQLFYEVMSCGQTDPEIFPFLMDMASKAGFQPVHARKESTGLVFNRIWAAVKRECLLVMAEGVSDARTIDSMFTSWFKAQKGPCLMMDTVGLDTVYNIEVVYGQQLGVDARARDWLKSNYVDKGNLGAKGGVGLLG